MKFTKTDPKKPKMRMMIKIDKYPNRVTLDANGRRVIYTEWIELEEVSLGSKKNPNKNILEVAFEPMRYEVSFD